MMVTVQLLLLRQVQVPKLHSLIQMQRLIQ